MSDNKKILQERLARGEISVAQYKDLLAVLADSVSAAERDKGALRLEVANEKCGNVALFDNAIALGAELIFIDDIRVLNVNRFEGKLNYSTIDRHTGFDMVTADGRTYSVTEARVFKKGANERHDVMSSIAATLQEKTFAARVNHALAEIKRVGHLNIGHIISGRTPVTLRRDGTLVCGGFSGSLRNCGTLDFGTRHAGFWGEYNRHSPNDVTFAERDIAQGLDIADKLFGKPRGSLIFTMSGAGSDVTHALLKWLREPRNVI